MEELRSKTRGGRTHRRKPVRVQAGKSAQYHPSLSTETSRLGRIAENLVIWYLRNAGWTIVARNYATRRGEIDIIASRMGEDICGIRTVAFIEVKARHTSDGLPPEASVTMSKRKKMVSTMRQYIGEHALDKAVYRCDVASLILEHGRAPRIRYYVNAFCGHEEFGW